jgi:hypothetical protein
MGTKLSDEFANRLNALELELERQQSDLQYLKDLETVVELEKKVRSTTNSAPKTARPIVAPTARPQPKTLPVEAPQGVFTVCLMFNRQNPSEWSEETNGWRIANHGVRFNDYNQAALCAKRLKSRFPDYPIEVIRVK